MLVVYVRCVLSKKVRQYRKPQSRRSGIKLWIEAKLGRFNDEALSDCVRRNLSLEIELFITRWLRIDAYTNRFNWDVVEPIKVMLYKKGWIRDKPLLLLLEEIDKARQHRTKIPPT